MSSDRKKALFLLHNFNDIDHMVPVIDAMALTGKWEITALFYPANTNGSIDFENDWRLQYIAQNEYAKIGYVDDLTDGIGWTLPLFRWREAIVKLCDSTPFLGRIAGRDIRGLLPWFVVQRGFDAFLRFWLTKGTLTGYDVLNATTPNVVVIDWGQTHNLVTPILEEAKRRKIPVAQLPHGAWTYEGVISHESQFDTRKLQKKSALPITVPDLMVVDNLYKALRSEIQGTRRSTMRFLGLARFSPDWLETLKSLPRASQSIQGKGKPKIVWFPTWLMACDRNAVKDMIGALEEFTNDLDIVLKVHTRNPKHEVEDYTKFLSPNSGIRVVANEVESFAMTLWADYVIVTQSSIIYDAFLLKKPVIYLRNTHFFECMWDYDKVCETVNNYDEFFALLTEIKNGTYRQLIDEERMHRYLSLAVFGGLPAEEIRNQYCAALLSLSEGRSVEAGCNYDDVYAQWEREHRQVVSIVDQANLAVHRGATPQPKKNY